LAASGLMSHKKKKKKKKKKKNNNNKNNKANGRPALHEVITRVKKSSVNSENIIFGSIGTGFKTFI
jgi:hypothetical protein